MTESERWRAALGGDAAAFASVFDAHRDRVYRHAFHLLADVPDAEDALASAFLELWRRRDRVRLVDGSVLPWLLVTTTNVARNLGRSRARYRAVLARLPRDPDDADPADIAADRLDGRASAERVASALRELPEKDAALITLVAVDELPVAVAATALHLSPGAARTRLHRIRKRLSGVLAELEASEEVSHVDS